MTGRTLEEIEALAAEATPGPWERLDCGLVCAVDSLTVCAMFNREDDDFPRADANGALIAELPRLLAIAQEQRAELLRRPRVGSCAWVSLDSDMDTRIWSTSCKQEWVFHAGSPQENGVKFCPHCGAEAEIEMPQDGD